MPNEDFSIKTGIQVDDGGLQKLKSFADSLTQISDALSKIGNSKFNTGLTSGMKIAQKDIDKTKKQITDLVDTVNQKNKKGNSNVRTIPVDQAVKSTFNSLDPEIYNKINTSLESAASAACSSRFFFTLALYSSTLL